MTKVRLTLVHGTWAKNAPWTNHPKLFTEPLQAHLGGDVELIPDNEPIKWTGRNRILDRRRAGKIIADRVSAPQTFDYDNHVVIGHSHGGSAIAYALREFPDKMSGVDGVAFLATPFVHARAMPQWQEMVATACRIVVFLIWLWLVYLGAYIVMEETFGDMDKSGFVVLGILLSTTIAILLLTPKLIFVAKERIGQRITDVISIVECSFLPTGKSYFFVRATADEAAAALSMAQILSWPFNRTLAMVAVLSNRFSNAVMSLWSKCVFWKLAAFITSSLLLLGVIFVLVAFFHPDTNDYSIPEKLVYAVANEGYDCMAPDAFETVCITGLRISTAIVVAMIITAASMISLFVLSSVFVLISYVAFGGSALKAGPFLELAVEPLPEGAHRFTVLTWAAAPSRNPYSLMHSEAYRTDESFERLSVWIRALRSKAC